MQTTDSSLSLAHGAVPGERVRPAAARSHCLLSRGFHSKAHAGRELGARSLHQALSGDRLCCHIISSTGHHRISILFNGRSLPGGDGVKVKDMGSPHPSLLQGQPPLPSLPFLPSPSFLQATFPAIS